MKSIYIPIGKSLVPVESKKGICAGCYFNTPEFQNDYGECAVNIYCNDYEREDGKNVIFKLVDYPAEGEIK